MEESIFVCMCHHKILCVCVRITFQVQMLAYWYIYVTWILISTVSMTLNYYWALILSLLSLDCFIAYLLSGEHTNDTKISSKGINHYYAIFSFTMDGPTVSLLKIIK